MLSKKNLVFKKNQTMVALNVHFYSTPSPGCLSNVSFCSEGDTIQGQEGRFFSLEQRPGWGLPPRPLGTSLAEACLQQVRTLGQGWVAVGAESQRPNIVWHP